MHHDLIPSLWLTIINGSSFSSLCSSSQCIHGMMSISSLKEKHMKLGPSLNFRILSNWDRSKKGTLKYTLSYPMGTDRQICFSDSFIKGNHSLPDVVMVSQVQRVAQPFLWHGVRGNLPVFTASRVQVIYPYPYMETLYLRVSTEHWPCNFLGCFCSINKTSRYNCKGMLLIGKT